MSLVINDNTIVKITSPTILTKASKTIAWDGSSIFNIGICNVNGDVIFFIDIDETCRNKVIKTDIATPPATASCTVSWDSNTKILTLVETYIEVVGGGSAYGDAYFAPGVYTTGVGSASVINFSNCDELAFINNASGSNLRINGRQDKIDLTSTDMTLVADNVILSEV
jgi:hypothetical protein